ncbi:class I adenylate-forming enzyme family protein [Aquipuribacter nitratireducens]|uniref:Class I adenylate-forming enzyme family protein n=1 Tax=Aquipuribacter nitratireducens TaxID=650104 RepID=A0ABW0GP47_9MICO
MPEAAPAYDRDAVEVVREPWCGGDVLSYRPRPRDVLDVLDHAVRHRPDAVALVDARDGRSRTARQLAADVVATAEEWTAAGLEPGDGVGIAAANGGDHLVALLACAATGAVAVGLSPRLAVGQWRYQLAHSRCRWLLHEPHDDEHAALARAAVDGVPGVRRIPSLASTGSPATDDWERFQATRTPAAPDQPYQVVYTSGSTGRPKASQVVHRASVHSGIAYDRLLRLRPGDSSGVLFSLGYISAVHAHVLPALLSGARLVMLPTGSPRTWVEQLARFDVTWAYAVPSWWSLALREPGLSGAGLPRLRLAGAGGSPFPDRLRDALAARLPDAELLNVYGLSETHSPATVLRGRELWEHPGAAGRPLEVVEVEVRDPDAPGGAALPDGTPGEVWLRSSLVTTGYAGDPAASAAAVRAGAFRTGDVGVLHRDGSGGVLTLLDRVKDLVNRAGVKVYSAEVERVLAEHPGIADAACVAVPDPRAGETVAVVLVASGPGPHPTDPEVRAWVRERLGTSAVPSVLRRVEALPRGGTGKTDKPALRRLLAAEGAPPPG